MNIGYRVYGLGALALGVVGLACGDFAAVWQPVPPDVPHRLMLAYLVGATEVLSGLALLWRRTAPSGAVVLAILYALGVALLHVPRIIAHPLSLSPWAGACEQTALVMGGLIAFAATAPIDSALALRLTRIGWIVFGICAIEFGAVHFVYLSDTVSYVPKWIPPSRLFWACATGVFHIAAGLAILSGIQARLAAYLLTAMFAVFGALVHAPLLADPNHLHWVMNAMNTALIGAAWVVADSLAERKSRA